MPLCCPPPCWHWSKTGAQEGGGFRASSGCLTMRWPPQPMEPSRQKVNTYPTLVLYGFSEK